MVDSEQNIVYKLYEKLIASTLKCFPEKGKPEVSQGQGVYIIYHTNEIALHVGRTVKGKNGINQRLKNHIYNKSSFARAYLKSNNIQVRSFCQFKFIEIEAARTRALLEALT